jgi:hypothetical protein
MTAVMTLLALLLNSMHSRPLNKPFSFCAAEEGKGRTTSDSVTR